MIVTFMQFVNLTVMSEHLNFLRLDHSRFWVANNKKYFASLPAILLTDTGHLYLLFVVLTVICDRTIQG